MRSPLWRRSARCCRVAGGLAWAGLSRALGFPLARGWWRGKLWTAVRLSLAHAYAPNMHSFFAPRLSYTDPPRIPSTEQTGSCTPLSADLICCLPTPLAKWLTRHSKRRIIGSLLLFCVWETVSSLLPQEWKTWGFPVLGGLLLASLGFWMDDKSMTATWVIASLVVCLSLGWIAVTVQGAL